MTEAPAFLRVTVFCCPAAKFARAPHETVWIIARRNSKGRGFNVWMVFN